MGLEPGQPIAGTPIDRVFIGSCTNSRIEDLRDAAQIANGRRVSPGVTAWVVPGSLIVKREAEAGGLDRVFPEAGFEWRGPGCARRKEGRRGGKGWGRNGRVWGSGRQ